jgi:uncharacterized protein YkwD
MGWGTRPLTAAVLTLVACAMQGVAWQGGVTPPPVREAPVPETPLLTDVETGVLYWVNAERIQRGLRPLKQAEDLAVIARAFSRDMVARGFFGHTDPDGHSVTHRVERGGINWRGVAENIARNRGYADPAHAAVTEWMKSEGHRRNILDDGYRETGVGVAIAADQTYYFTQVFLTRGTPPGIPGN